MPKLVRLTAALLALVLVGVACDDGDDNSVDDAPPPAEDPGSEGDEGLTAPPEGGERVDPGSGAALVAVAGEGADEHLADANGFSLYLFTSDDEGGSNCSGGCASTWPPLVTPTEDVALGEGIDEALVGTIERDDGSLQVTFAGNPLYYFSGDTVAGETNGQGSGGVWFLVAADGSAIEA